jgi:hypothetical protein
MRVVLEIADNVEQIQGTAILPAAEDPIPFHGWLALMRLLETAQAGIAPTSAPDADDH